MQRSVVSGGPCRKHLLSGILRCGHCGGLLLATSGSPGSAKRNPPYVYYKCQQACVTETCADYAARADQNEPRVIECFKSVWLTEPAKKMLRQALVSLADETARGRPSRRAGLEAGSEKLASQIIKGSENLLLLARLDIPDTSAMLGQWREQRNQLQAAMDEGTWHGVGKRIVRLLAEQSGFNAIAIRSPIRSGHQDRAVREDGAMLGTFVASVADTSVKGH